MLLPLNVARLRLSQIRRFRSSRQQIHITIISVTFFSLSIPRSICPFILNYRWHVSPLTTGPICRSQYCQQQYNVISCNWLAVFDYDLRDHLTGDHWALRCVTIRPGSAVQSIINARFHRSTYTCNNAEYVAFMKLFKTGNILVFFPEFSILLFPIFNCRQAMHTNIWQRQWDLDFGVH